MRKSVLFFVVLFCVFFSNAQELTKNEKELYKLMMEYRKSKKLSIIPLSKSLITVAQIHSRDLAQNHSNNDICNAHSWSNNGAWESCCYTSDHAKASCMWNKPKELTSYNYPGYEIACVGNETLSPLEALENWKTSKAHNNVIINGDIWDSKWEAIGIGMYKGYATVWFGHYPDP